MPVNRPRTAAERQAIARGQKRAWEARRRKQAETDRLAAAAEEAKRLASRIAGEVTKLKAENAELRRKLQIRTRADEVRSGLASVESERMHQSGTSLDHAALARALGKRRILEDRLARLDKRSRR